MSLVASDELLVPLQTEFFALEGITQLVKTIDRIKENLNPSLSIRGILLTMFDKRNKLSSEVDREARNYFKDKVYQTVIQRNVRLSEAPSHGLPCVIYDKNCVGSKSYLKLAEEFSKKQNRKRSMKTGKKKGLGRGLSALFGDDTPKEKIIEKKELNKVSISDLSQKSLISQGNFFTRQNLKN